MLSKWALAVTTATLIFVGLPGMAFAQEKPDSGAGKIATDITMKLERDGRISVTERVTVDGGPVRRTVPLRQAAGDNAERVFTVRDASVDGPGTVRVNEDELTLNLRPGVSTLTYSVLGAVAPTGATQEVRWQVTGGWNAPVSKAEVSSFIAPKVPQAIDCLAGPIGSSGECDLFEIGHTQSVRAQKSELQSGDRMDLSITLPAGTVPVNVQIDEYFSVTSAFALTPTSGAGLTGVGLLLIGGFGLLWYTRGRDARAMASDANPVDVLMEDADGTISFASPDGVLPGQVGTVVDEHVDVVDVTTTVLDLAVRNYLWIEELPGEQEAKDWRLVRLNAPDDALRPYERAVYEILLGAEHGPEAKEEVLLSDLRSGEPLDLTGVRDALYADVVDKNWFSKRPDTERNRFWWGALGLAIAGVALTVVLALTSSLALIGVAVTLGGIALTFGARLMPARTRRGSALVAQMRGLREYLHSESASSIPENDREMVFSRSLPYAVVLDESERWLNEFADLDPGADGTPGLYWYGEFVEQAGHVVPNLRRFRTHFPLLIASMDSALGKAGHLRSMK